MNELNARFYDLDAIQLADGTIRLTQQSGLDEPHVIDLHPQQLRYVAEQSGVIEPARISRSAERQLWKLYEDAGELSDYLNGIASFPMGPNTTADQTMAADLFDGLESLLDDLGLMERAEPEQPPAEPPKPNKFALAQQSPPKCQQQGDLLGGIQE